MADIELVIKIPEEDYKLIRCVKHPDLFLLAESRIMLAVKNGIPLPEHHGRLIDADAFLAWLIFKGYIDNARCGEVAEAIRKTTIIPATKEGAE